MSVADEKRVVRQQVLRRREEIPAEERKAKSLAAAENLLALEPLANCRTVMLFLSFGSEIDTEPFIEAARARGQEIWLPLTNLQERRIIPYVYSPELVLRQGVYGIREPDPTRAEPADSRKLEAVILPGVAFDRSGGRLGYGGGFYDRFLASLSHKPVIIGYCFDEQIVDLVPRENHDVQYDYLITNS